MSIGFWIRRFITVAAGAFVVLLAVELLKGHGWKAGAAFSALWSLISTTVFVVTRVYYARRGVACAVCMDTPE